jgi:DMSO/TMAO reductase YedYZ molybdopterin-dependent catalytic subunit
VRDPGDDPVRPFGEPTDASRVIPDRHYGDSATGLSKRDGGAPDGPGPVHRFDTEAPSVSDPVVESRTSSTGGEADVVVTGPPEHALRRVPPGQRVTRGWPVLHEGPVPSFDPLTWRLQFIGACNEPYEVSYAKVQAFPKIELHSDFHCVTGWSKLDNVWRGVPTKALLDKTEPAADATHVLVHAERGYAANLPLEILMQEEAALVWSHNGQDLAPEHGFPLRLIVPRLYGWKSVKWVRAIELRTQDKRGFWETRGYHNHGDPWREERYSYQEA